MKMINLSKRGEGYCIDCGLKIPEDYHNRFDRCPLCATPFFDFFFKQVKNRKFIENVLTSVDKLAIIRTVEKIANWELKTIKLPNGRII